MNEFVKDTLMRCLYTFAEVMLGFVAVGSAFTEIHWGHALSVAGVAVIVCILKQIAVNFKPKNEVPAEFDLLMYQTDEEGDVDE